MGTARFFRHFHDPLQPWDQAGLHPYLDPPFDLPWPSRWESAVRWAQQTNQQATTAQGDYSWVNARAYFHQALTAETKEQRDAAFAQTFRALGQMMHLLTDMAVPEHTRDDMHPLDGPFGYEGWVLAQHRGAAGPGGLAPYLQHPPPIDPALFALPISSEEPIAKAPIARLFDSDRYNKPTPDPAVTAEPLIGLAEVTHANFFSPDTIPGKYAYPDRATLEAYDEVYDPTGIRRIYYRKPAPGLVVTPVLVECVLNELAKVRLVCKDQAVWRETARHLLPRAVGYAAALLDYFFRGELDFALRPGPDDATRQLVVTNRSAERLDGTVTLYADAADGTRTAVPGATRTGLVLDPGATAPGIPFPAPPPAAGYVLVFQGTLGQDAGAIIGKVLLPRVVFAVQETVGMLGEEVVPPPPDPSWPLPDYLWRVRAMDQSHQQAAGAFVLPGETTPGDQIAAVRLVFSQPPSEGAAATLHLTGASGDTLAVGHEWTRTAGPPLAPVRWRLEARVPQTAGCLDFECAQLAAFPGALEVATLAGLTWQTPLLWWGSISSSTDSYVGHGGLHVGVRLRSVQIKAAVVFGGGEPSGQALLAPFAAAQGIAGFAPGAIVEESTRDALVCEAGGYFYYCQSGSFVEQAIRVFADTVPVAGMGSGTQATLRWSTGDILIDSPDAGSLFPALENLPPDEPPALPPLAFTRTYLPSERALLDALGVLPPAYTVQVLPRW